MIFLTLAQGGDPLIVVFGLEPTAQPEAEIKEDYERIRKSLSAVFLGKRSIKVA